MKALLTVCSVIGVVAAANAHDPKNAAAAPWGQIRLLSRERSADVDTYLKSLTTEEMLTAARQACREVEEEEDSEQYHDAPGWAAAEFHCIICLRYYFDKVDRDEGGAALLKIVQDRSESHLLRRALISRLRHTKVPFDVEFQAHVKDNQADVTALLTRMLKDKSEPWLVRDGAMEFLTGRLDAEVGKITRLDENVRAIKERTHSVVPVGKLLRSGELTLTEETLKALDPIQARTLELVKILGAILGDESEPKEFRKCARRRVEMYSRSALTGIDDEVEKALQQAAD